MKEPRFAVGDRVRVVPLEILRTTPLCVDCMLKYADMETFVTKVEPYYDAERRRDSVAYHLADSRELGDGADWNFDETALELVERCEEVSKYDLMRMLLGGDPE